MLKSADLLGSIPTLESPNLGLNPATDTPLTGIVLHQGLEGGEGGPGGDVVTPFIQGSDLIVLDHVPLGGDILHRQGEGP